MKILKFNETSKIIAMAFVIMILAACENSNDSNETVSIPDFTYPLVQSGQTILYDNDGNVVSSISVGEDFYGQDANYLKGLAMSYINNGDGTISDFNTGLMWEEIPIPTGLTYEEAIAYCDSLSLGGYEDWRMPSLKELFSISDFGKGWPYLDTSYFKLASGIVDKSEQFWSSNRYVGVTTEGGDNAAFGVNHVTGHIKAYPAASTMTGGDAPTDGAPQGTGDLPTDTTSTATTPPSGTDDDSAGQMPPADDDIASFSPLTKHVRAVRGDVYGENDFSDNEDGTISDNASGLMWTQDDSGEGMDWETALEYAESATIAGYTDWRLPNIKELQAIVDYSYASNAQDEAQVGPAINPIFNCTPIVNEAGNDDYPYFWTSTSANFSSGQPYYYGWYVAFGQAVDGDGNDTHGAGAVRFDTKYEGGPLGEGGERYYNYVRLVRDIY